MNVLRVSIVEHDFFFFMLIFLIKNSKFKDAYCWHLTKCRDEITNFFCCSYFSSHFTAISPLCHNLFSLYDETTGLWYPPNHEFKITEETSITVHYRMRYEAAWLGVNSCWRQSVWRADVSKHTKAFPFCSCARLALTYARVEEGLCGDG